MMDIMTDIHKAELITALQQISVQLKTEARLPAWAGKIGLRLEFSSQMAADLADKITQLDIADLRSFLTDAKVLSQLGHIDTTVQAYIPNTQLHAIPLLYAMVFSSYADVIESYAALIDSEESEQTLPEFGEERPISILIRNLRQLKDGLLTQKYQKHHTDAEGFRYPGNWGRYLQLNNETVIYARRVLGVISSTLAGIYADAIDDIPEEVTKIRAYIQEYDQLLDFAEYGDYWKFDELMQGDDYHDADIKRMKRTSSAIVLGLDYRDEGPDSDHMDALIAHYGRDQLNTLLDERNQELLDFGLYAPFNNVHSHDIDPQAYKADIALLKQAIEIDASKGRE